MKGDNVRGYMKVKIDDGAFLPERKHTTDAGLDLKAPSGDPIGLMPNDMVHINTGVHIELPSGYVGLIKSRSGLNRQGIHCEGVIDECYRGAIGITLYNDGDDLMIISPGDRIAQLLVVPCLYVDLEVVDKLSQTDRGENGFGSTGV